MELSCLSPVQGFCPQPSRAPSRSRPACSPLPLVCLRRAGCNHRVRLPTSPPVIRKPRLLVRGWSHWTEVRTVSSARTSAGRSARAARCLATASISTPRGTPRARPGHGAPPRRYIRSRVLSPRRLHPCRQVGAAPQHGHVSHVRWSESIPCAWLQCWERPQEMKGQAAISSPFALAQSLGYCPSDRRPAYQGGGSISGSLSTHTSGGPR